MNRAERSSVAMLVLRGAAQVIDGIQDGLRRRGYTDVRPAHGFAFVRISAGNATVVDVAEHLGVTKQAASKTVDLLVEAGYVQRNIDPQDGRAWLLSLTSRGRACTAAAEEAAAEVVADWQRHVGTEDIKKLGSILGSVVGDGPLRPSW